MAMTSTFICIQRRDSVLKGERMIAVVSGRFWTQSVLHTASTHGRFGFRIGETGGRCSIRYRHRESSRVVPMHRLIRRWGERLGDISGECEILRDRKSTR